MSNRLDIVLFGASGFTGTYCIESVHKLTKANGRRLTWGIAGRSEKRLKEALHAYENSSGEDLSSLPVIVADVNDFESLKRMTSRAKVIINCCGPYRFYGEAVVKACIETGTHQVDVSGEPQYMEMIQYKYNKAAEEKGLYIVSACGFDSIPSEFGVQFVQDKFEGTINSVELYLQFLGSSAGPNFATFESAVYGVGAAKELGQLRRKLYPTPLPKFLPRLEPRPSIHRSSIINKWCVPFIGADRSVVQRSQRYLFDHKKIRPLQLHAYIGLSSMYTLILMVVLGAIFSFLAQYKLGRYFLLKYPSIFTAGYIKSERRTKTGNEEGKLEMILRAEGWSEKLSNADEFKTPPNKIITVRLTANNPAYTLTSNLTTLSAITILSEGGKLPKSGGVYTPGIAFRETTMLETVQKNSWMKFEILQ